MKQHHCTRRELLKAAGLMAAGGALGLPRTGHTKIAGGGKPDITNEEFRGSRSKFQQGSDLAFCCFNSSRAGQNLARPAY